MRLKLDENLGSQIADMLRQAGRDVTTVAEQDMRRADDRSLIHLCRQEGRGLVTLDLEFGNPLLFPPSDYHGIAVLRLRSGSSPGDLYDAVRTLAGGLEQDALDGRLWIFEPERIRLYQEEDPS